MSSEEARRRSREYYRVNRDRLAHQSASRRAGWRLRLLQIVGETRCKDCGNSDERVLQFDHIGDDKVNNVAHYLDRSWIKALEEARKCEVVCANCHVIRTRNRYRSFEDQPAQWAHLSKSHCPSGHPKTPENRLIIKNGRTSLCKVCSKIRAREYRKKKKTKQQNGQGIIGRARERRE